IETRPEELSILEIGFGTGLNALVTWQEARRTPVKISYTGVEAYPIEKAEIIKLNFSAEINEEGAQEIFEQLHSLAWEQTLEITPNFLMHKQKKFFEDIDDISKYDLVYFDAFGARVQPDLWTTGMFSKMFKALKPGGILVTYAAKGSVRRAMLEVGFQVERLPGPPGKREMLRATKISVLLLLNLL